MRRYKDVFKKILRIKKTDMLCSLIEKGLIIGEHTICHSVEGIDGIYPWLIEIGDYCMISTNVKVYAHDSSLNPFCQYTKIGCVSIGNHVYIGQGTTILCGVNIGDNVVIGAHSLVNKDLSSGKVYAGNPVREIGSTEDLIEKHLKAIELKKSTVFNHGWLYWKDKATMFERKQMKELLKDGPGYIDESH